MKKQFLLLTMMLLPMMASAHALEVQNADGVTIYYNYTNNATELEVTNNNGYGGSYTGNVVIPEEVTYMNRTRKVTSIGFRAFENCTGLTSVTIPNSVTSIGDNAFSGCSVLASINIPDGVTYIGQKAFLCCFCITSITIPNSVTSISDNTFRACIALASLTIPNSVTSIGSEAFSGCYGLTSITIPNSVTSIGGGAFYGVDVPTVISHIENPFEIIGKTSEHTRTFSLNTFNNATLYVPKGTIDKYKTTIGWKDFLFIEEGTGEGSSTPEKCAKPTISYINDKLIFDSSTEGATCCYSITDSDIKAGSGSEVQLTATYNISVYATKEGYDDSETATAILCWLAEPQTEGFTDGMAQIAARPVLVKTNNGFITVEGADDKTNVSIYTTDGKQLGSAISMNKVATIATSIQTGSIVIVKVGEKAIKVMMK